MDMESVFEGGNPGFPECIPEFDLAREKAPKMIRL
jgi:hypothetical protein